MKTTKTPTDFLTGWCEGPNHRLCHHTYTMKDDEAPVVCSCDCHKEED